MKSTQAHRGIALVIVLGFLVLLSGLAIAFFSSVTTELKASRTYASNVSTRQLADSAVNLVMGQIREATSKPEIAWASQPGMIRVYDTPTGINSPKAVNFFKLYSARNMVVTGNQIDRFDPGADPYTFTSDPTGDTGDVPSDWDNYPGLFTDLNSPVMVTDPGKPDSLAQPVFPILDPRAKEEVDGEPLVEGFDFYPDVNKAVASGDSDSWRVPMPVRWIYVLRDGTLTVPKEYSGTGGASGAQWDYGDFRDPTAANPIVGRIAFWADDDTSKININTAGGRGKQSSGGYSDGYSGNSYAGSFWDTPRFFTNFDIGQTDKTDGTLIRNVGAGGLAATQPFQKEFQRYPGHPATTSMGAVFARLLTSEQIYKLAPRLNGAGSTGGTVRVEKSQAEKLNLALDLKNERLYASLDELLYSAQPVNGGKRETNDEYVGVAGAVTPDKLEKMKFFLTAHSRSPDLNLFGRPRVCIWPVNQVTSELSPLGRNGTDRAIAYCSTIGGQRFIFTRNASAGVQTGALSLSQDIQAAGKVSSNVVLMNYLRGLTGKNIPGFGRNFKDKYDADGANNRDAILGEIFDYIRIANLRDTTTGMGAYQYAKFGVVAPSRFDLFKTGRIGGFGRSATISEATICFYVSAVGKTEDDRIQEELPEDERANIKYRYISAFVFFSTFDPMQGYAPKVSTPKALPGTPAVTEPDRDAMRQIFVVKGLNNFKLDGQEMDFPAEARNRIVRFSGETWAGRNFGGYEGFAHTLEGHGAAPGGTDTSDKGPYQFRSLNEIKVPVSGVENPKISFSGGEVELKIYMGTENPNKLLQTIKLKFPSGSWPVPERWYNIAGGGFVKADQTDYNVTDDPGNGANDPPRPGRGKDAKVEQAQNLLNFDGYRGRIDWLDLPADTKNAANMFQGNRWRQILQPGDIVRSLVYGSNSTVARDGDLRILALTDEVGEKEFSPHPDWANDVRFACGLRTATGNTYAIANMTCWKLDEKDAVRSDPPNKTLKDSTGKAEPGTVYGNHVSGATVTPAKAIQLPKSKVTGEGPKQVMRSKDNLPGDFDTGLGTFADGPFAGKQDEGNSVFRAWDRNQQKWIFPIPYASTDRYEEPGDIFFSPNRQMPSPVLFGSLPARPKSNNPRRHWETLAFCPNTRGELHPGNIELPRDHLLLDLFTMPFVEPYLISEPLSTAGRVNLNYQIAPFGYIKRSTALRAALHPLRVTAVKTDLIQTYKSGVPNTNPARPLPLEQDNPRLEIDRDQTLGAIDGFFARYKKDRNDGFFRSASQICERFFYPKEPNQVSGFTPGDIIRPYDPLKIDEDGNEREIRDFWKTRSLTGDNVREKPYADLYPRIDVRSNTYTVHMRVQTIRQVGGVGGDFKKWQEGRDVILGEYRGASTIERYIDPSDRRLSDPSVPGYVNVTATKYDPRDTATRSMEDLYRFRVLDTKKFTP